MVKYLDNLSGKIFCGNGHVILERPPNSCRILKAQAHSVSMEKTSFLVTWTKTESHCRYSGGQPETPLLVFDSRAIATPAKPSSPAMKSKYADTTLLSSENEPIVIEIEMETNEATEKVNISTPEDQIDLEVENDISEYNSLPIDRVMDEENGYES
ncbi:hypothetical protein BDB01DRAFT_840020 [Pilobolus umbonatus]|nr:hypothetical protein BDB01DRAFT_840020 [Pilobolus umbonatus]